MTDKEDHFQVLRKIKNNKNSTQRELAKELGFSLGKLNYCLKALKHKGLVKLKNFQKQEKKTKIFAIRHHTERYSRKNKTNH